MNARELMEKAERAAESARLLLEVGDFDGACNRGYYAMFDAARAALLASHAPVAAEVARSHGGLIAAFSLHLVKTGQVSIELGRALNRAEDIRLIADYRGDPIERDLAVWTVEQAEGFVRTMRQKFMGLSDSQFRQE